MRIRPDAQRTEGGASLLSLAQERRRALTAAARAPSNDGASGGLVPGVVIPTVVEPGLTGTGPGTGAETDTGFWSDPGSSTGAGPGDVRAPEIPEVIDVAPLANPLLGPAARGDVPLAPARTKTGTQGASAGVSADLRAARAISAYQRQLDAANANGQGNAQDNPQDNGEGNGFANAGQTAATFPAPRRVTIKV